MDKILFICEGEQTEKRFCNLIIDKYFIKNNKEKEYVAFGTNIYSLYDEMSRDECLDIIELIKERAKKKKDMYNFSKLSKGGFSEIYLIFDFDFQSTQYSDEKIISMLNFFNNETEHGKLYLNYPMIESYKHFRSIPDSNFNTYKVAKNECQKYKEYINNITVVPHFSDINDEVLKIIIKQNIDKVYYLKNIKKKDYDSYKKILSQKNILDLQLKEISKNESVFVINTSIFWGIDYFGRKKYEECMELPL